VPDIAAIIAAISHLTTATDVVRYLRDAEQVFKTADLKLRIADLVDALANAKLALTDVQELLSANDEEIKRLREALKLKGEVVRHRTPTTTRTMQAAQSESPFVHSVLTRNTNSSTLSGATLLSP